MENFMDQNALEFAGSRKHLPVEQNHAPRDGRRGQVRPSDRRNSTRMERPATAGSNYFPFPIWISASGFTMAGT